MASHTSVLVRRRNRTAARRWISHNALREHEELLLVVGFLAAVGVTALASWRWPLAVPPVMMSPWIVTAALFLRLRHLALVYAVAFICVLVPVTGLFGPRPNWNTLAVVAITILMFLMYTVATSRARLGVRGLHGESLMVDLRDRLSRSAQIPELPEGWVAHCAIKSAHGEGFAGDFIVMALSTDDRHFEVALVDVSGKGRAAGSRALHLSGALSGLIGSVDPERFLGSANAYVLRQRWDEGFATAIHISIDLQTGQYAVGRAGHPPAVLFRSGSGTWQVERAARGTLLGIADTAEFVYAQGGLDRGDALMIYTDGVIESRGHDLIDGLDRALGVASNALVGNRPSAADEVIAAARSGNSDDRAVFILRRC